jgi:hypothetical protein
MYINEWEIFKGNLSQILAAALKAGKADADDTVWRGPSGGAVIASDPADLDEEYAEYTDAGTVAEYIRDDEDDEPITLQEAADWIGYAYSSLAEGAREGRFEARRSGATWLTTRAAIQTAIDSGRMRGPRSK